MPFPSSIDLPLTWDKDSTFFTLLFESQQRRLFHHALRITRDHGRAEDVVSQTFLQLWRMRERLPPQLPEGTVSEKADVVRLAMGICTNIARNSNRSKRRYEAALARLMPVESSPDFTDEVNERILQAQVLSALRRAFGQLRPSDQQVITVCLRPGLSPAAAARALDVSDGALRVRLSRARQRLRRLTAAELSGSDLEDVG